MTKQDNVPGAMTTQNAVVQPYDPAAAAKAKKNVKPLNGEGVVVGRLEHLNVRPEHIAKEQKKQDLVAEGKLLEAERSRYQ